MGIKDMSRFSFVCNWVLNLPWSTVQIKGRNLKFPSLIRKFQTEVDSINRELKYLSKLTVATRHLLPIDHHCVFSQRIVSYMFDSKLPLALYSILDLLFLQSFEKSFINCKYIYSLFFFMCEIVNRGRSYSYSHRHSPLRYSQSPHYDRKYSRCPEYYSPARSRRYSRWVVILLFVYFSHLWLFTPLRKVGGRGVVCTNF